MTGLIAKADVTFTPSEANTKGEAYENDYGMNGNYTFYSIIRRPQ
jgi:hypothetical protein